MKFYFRSFLFLAIINFLLLSPILIFLEAHFLIPGLAVLIVINAYIHFFYPSQILQKLSIQHFAPNDPWNVSSYLQKIQSQNPSFTLKCYKIKKNIPIALCFGNQKKYYIILSENLLDTISKEGMQFLLSYYSSSCSMGFTSFLNTISGFIYLIQAFLSIPGLLFKPFKRKNQLNICVIGCLSFLSFFTKSSFLKMDLRFTKTDEKRKKWASFIWKMDSICKLNKSNLPVFFTPFFISNPLTNPKWECYISLHPNIRTRVENLIDSYPPEN